MLQCHLRQFIRAQLGMGVALPMRTGTGRLRRGLEEGLQLLALLPFIDYRNIAAVAGRERDGEYPRRCVSWQTFPACCCHAYCFCLL
jgi:hypothetical protein